MNYAERMVNENNKMDIETTNQEMEGLYSLSPNSNMLQHPFQGEAAPNNTTPSNPSTVPVTLSAILYEANSPVDPNLWDSHFGSVSLFSTNKFLQSDARNISCSLIHIAQFIRQRDISERDGNLLSQLSSFGDTTFDFISAIHEAGWYKLNTLDNTPVGNKIKGHFSNQSSTNTEKTKNLVEKIPSHIPLHLTSKQIEESRKWLDQKKNEKNPHTTKSYAQVSAQAADLLKLKDTFLALPNKKIMEIHNTSLNITQPKNKKISITTKELSRKQAIIPLLGQHVKSIMNNAGLHISSINGLLKSVKSTLRAEFIRPMTESIVVCTNNVPASSDLSIMEKYFKSINSIGLNKVAAPQLPQLKSYLKITGISYIQPSGLAISSDDITNYLKNSDLFEGITLTARLWIIKASPKSDMAIIWIDI